MNLNNIKKLLNYRNKIELIGSNKLDLKYTTDYDFQVRHIIEAKDNKEKKRIVKHFQNIFQVIENIEKAYITDFKSGLFRGPIRWNHKEQEVVIVR